MTDCMADCAPMDRDTTTDMAVGEGALRGRTLAVIGASYLQRPLVEKARSMGLRVLCFAWEDGAVCRDLADRFFPISIVEKEPIAEICRAEHVDGVTTIASDVAVATVSHVAMSLGLVGNTERSAFLSTNKGAMREALRDAGVNCPSFHRVRKDTNLAPIVERIGFPLIVKPSDRSGSMGVARVDTLGERGGDSGSARGLALWRGRGRGIDSRCAGD